MYKILVSILIIITILILSTLILKTINYKSKPQNLTGTIHIIKFKNNYTQNDFFKELEKINPVAHATYESNYSIPFLTTHLQRETILMLPVFRKNFDVMTDEFSIISPTQLYFELPLTSYEEHNYPINHIDLNLPSFAMIGSYFDCKNNHPKRTLLLDTENYTATIEFNISKCALIESTLDI